MMKARELSQYSAVTLALVVAFCLLALLGIIGAAQASEADKGFETGEIVVKLEPTSGATIEDINADYGSTTLEKLLGSAGIYLLRLPSGSDEVEASKGMNNDPRLLYAEPNFVAEAPEAGARHKARGEDLYPALTSDQYAVEALNLSRAHGISRGASAKVAVLDTGAQLDHPDLEDNFAGVKGYDFVDDDADPSDHPVGLDANGNGYTDEMVGHGTHVAGIVDLVAPEAKIMPLRVLDQEGYGNVFLAAEAVLYAKRNGADVINMSFSTPGRSALLQDVIGDATEKGEGSTTATGAVVVAAAGNDDDTAAQYPAAGEGVMAVTSVDSGEEKSDFASYGTWVDIAAPGEEIYSAFPVSETASGSGTSMATPFVAGQAALIHDVDGSLDPARIETVIRDTARSLDTQNPSYKGMLGAGHSDIGASLEQLGGGDGGTANGDNEGD